MARKERQLCGRGEELVYILQDAESNVRCEGGKEARGDEYECCCRLDGWMVLD